MTLRRMMDDLHDYSHVRRPSPAASPPRRQRRVDFLIEIGPVTSSWFPAGLVLDLEALLGRRVEVTEKALNPALRDSVLREAVAL